MTTSSKQVDSPAKEDNNASDGKIATASSRSMPWLKSKDPRIVRVSRALGGKDRHSKVCTIRGLRDRRVRLSVPTAIQLYDLQERLGLNQPSKVVDWLLEAAKHEIDELPPLPMQPLNFVLNHQHHAMLSSSSLDVGALQPNKEGFKTNNNTTWENGSELPRPNFLNLDALLRVKSKEVVKDSVDEKENWTRGNEEDKNERNEGHGAHSSSSFLPRTNPSSSLGLANNAIPYGSFFHVGHPNFQLGSHGFTPQAEDPHNLNLVPLQSSSSLSSDSQVLAYPPGAPQSYFPSSVTTSTEIDPRQINQFQMLTSSTQNFLTNTLTASASTIPLSQSVRPLHLSVTSRLQSHSTEQSGRQDKDQFKDYQRENKVPFTL
uniref:Uncharacterized protein MANES_02G055900 n=1 Tax=Rhizophora mucronata TaxID=61149 RepID=A0A2P2IVL6_RHIMU